MAKRFQINRKEDVSGISGTGCVAEGVQFTNGKVVVGWCVDLPSIEIHDHIEDVLTIHGHEGRTVIEWIDDED